AVQTLAVRVTFLTDFDAEGVLAVEKAVEPSPLSAPDLAALRKSPGVNGRIAVTDSGPFAGGRLVGFCLFRLGSHDVELFRLSVHPGYRRRGAGRALAACVAGLMEAWPRDSVGVTVRERALGSQLFLHRLGYRGTGVVRGAFPDTGEDGFRLVYTRPGAPIARGGGPGRAGCQTRFPGMFPVFRFSGCAGS